MSHRCASQHPCRPSPHGLRLRRGSWAIPVLAVAAWLFLPSPLQARPAPGPPARVADSGGVGESAPVVTNLTLDDLESLVRGMGLSPTREKANAVRFKLAGYTTFLLSKGPDIQLYAWFDNKVSLEKINDWNRKQRFTRAYKDKDGDAVLECDLDLEGGVTLENVKAFIDFYRNMLPRFANHLTH